MPSPKELAEIMQNLDQMRLEPDDNFRFKCYGCGKCCKNRDDILLTPQDLFRLAKHLELSPGQVIDRYCETYIGSQSHLPIVRLKPIGKNQVCPMLKDNRCSVHAAKPSVCALYPLGRYAKASTIDPTGPLEFGFFKLPVICGGHKQITVRTYLESFNIPIKDEFHTKWNEIAMLLTSFCGKALSKGVSEQRMLPVWNTILQLFYLAYFDEAEFLPAFERNVSVLKRMMQSLEQDGFAGLLKADAQ